MEGYQLKPNFSKLMQYLQILINVSFNYGSNGYKYKISSTLNENLIVYGQLNLHLLPKLIRIYMANKSTDGRLVP